MPEYQVCSRCVMDNASDNTITFNEKGHCNYCTNALKVAPSIYFPNKEGERKLDTLVAELKETYKDKDYDCLMGISGGLDSSYLAYIGYKKGLRILAVHVDDGYDTQISQDNIQKLSKAANINLVTIKPDPEQFNDLSLAFFLAGVPNLAIPQDNILFAVLFKYAARHKIQHFLSGGNFALECILQQGNAHSYYDLRNIKHIHKLYGSKPIDKLNFLSYWNVHFYRSFYNITGSLRPLNYIDYNRERALQELKDFCDFQYYGRKHLENTFTKFVQVYYLYHKFHVDKRRSHFSSMSMIASGQMSRSEALRALERPIYEPNEMERDINFIIDNWNLSRAEFDRVMQTPPKKHSDYKISMKIALKKVIKRA